MSARPPPLSLSARLRLEVRLCGLSLEELTRLTGLNRGTLSRFLRGERSMTLRTADALCAVLGLRLTTEAGAGGRK